MLRTCWRISRSFLAAVCLTSTASDGAAENWQNESVLKRFGSPAADRLLIEQSDDGGHQVTLHLQSEGSLLLGDDWARNTISSLGPGRVVQAGSMHVLTAHFVGDGHQFALRQTGRSHQATVSSRGRANLVSIAQAGQGNVAGVTQSGMRNSVVISQN